MCCIGKILDDTDIKHQPASVTTRKHFTFCNSCDDLPLRLSLQDHPWVELAEALLQLFVICCWWAPDYRRSWSGKSLSPYLYMAAAWTHASLTNIQYIMPMIHFFFFFYTVNRTRNRRPETETSSITTFEFDNLKIAGATFQHLLNLVVWWFGAVYLDSLWCSDTWPEHLKHVQVSFDRLVWANLPGNLAKPEFAKATLTYLYMVVGQGQVPRVRARL